MDITDNITVVIPCKNEGSSVVNVIDRIKSSNPNIKVIVADSSNDNTVQLINENFPETIVIEGGLPAAARNKGASLIETPYVLFLDADIYIQLDTIYFCLQTAIQGNYDLVTCKFKTDKPYRWVFKLFYFIQCISYLRPFALGGFMLFKKDTFNKLGGFNENVVVGEDYELSSKIKPKKFKITNHYIYTPARRFKNKGVWYMIKLMFNCWINRNNIEYFKNDHNYWK